MTRAELILQAIEAVPGCSAVVARALASTYWPDYGEDLPFDKGHLSFLVAELRKREKR